MRQVLFEPVARGRNVGGGGKGPRPCPQGTYILVGEINNK